MNLLAVDFSNLGELLTFENIKFVIQIVAFLVVGFGFVYQTGTVAVEKYKRKKAEREKDEAYMALDAASKVMINVTDGMSLLVNSSRNIKTEDKMAFNEVATKQVEVAMTLSKIAAPIVDALKEEAKEIFDDIKDEGIGLAVDLGKSVLDNYINKDV